MAERSYPYTAQDGTCAYDASNTTGKGTTGYTNVTPDDANAMKAALALGPLSVSIDASHQAFQYYTSGILADAKKCGTRLDHAVIVVGWGVEGTTEYWTVRNSWGASWGEAGYIRMAIIDGTGVCGVQMEPLYPNL
jgi:cathepsin L